jgi:hypothetical protein
MTIKSIARSLRPEVRRALRVSETQRAFHDRVLDGVRKFLDDHAVTGKTGARDFYEFEAELHARLMEAERCSVPLPSRHFRARDSGVSCTDGMSQAA